MADDSPAIVMGMTATPQGRERSVSRHLLGSSLFVSALLALCVVAVSATPDDTAAAQAAELKRNCAILRDAYGKGQGARAIWMQGFLDQVESHSVAADDWRRGLAMLVEDSKRGRLKGGIGSGVVTDEAAADVLTSALQSKDSGVLSFAVETLTWETGKRVRERFAKDIKAALGPHPQLSAEVLLLATCDLSPEERQAVLSWKRVPVAARALCGDVEAEAILISQFEASDDYFGMAKLARQLAYVGTQDCQEALVRALRSSVTQDSVYEVCSIRGKVLLALGVIYEEEQLFTADAYLLTSNSDEVFDQRRGLESYIRAVDAWVRERFGHAAWGDDEVWFRRMKNIPIVAPFNEGLGQP